ncbi:hypothetical protein [Uliginosibacterium sp. H1]|uniref:hypothetical protein n=1 Tax=Uliginosibacterium sp. H1 TaxID=3114757 RepID=UPI003FCD4794
MTDTSPRHRAHRDVFCYFDNTEKEQAPHNAMQMLEKLGIPRHNTYENTQPAKPARKARASRAKTE